MTNDLNTVAASPHDLGNPTNIARALAPQLAEALAGGLGYTSAVNAFREVVPRRIAGFTSPTTRWPPRSRLTKGKTTEQEKSASCSSCRRHIAT